MNDPGLLERPCYAVHLVRPFLDVLRGHPAVSEVAVVGLADERWGKIVCAFVKRAVGVAPEELDHFLHRLGSSLGDHVATWSPASTPGAKGRADFPVRKTPMTQ